MEDTDEEKDEVVAAAPVSAPRCLVHKWYHNRGVLTRPGRGAALLATMNREETWKRKAASEGRDTAPAMMVDWPEPTQEETILSIDVEVGQGALGSDVG